MAKSISTYQLKNLDSDDASSSTFTEHEADICIVRGIKSYLEEGSHAYWLIEVEDRQGNLYEWKDFKTVVDANATTIRLNIRNHLINNIEKVRESALTNTEEASVLGVSASAVLGKFVDGSSLG